MTKKLTCDRCEEKFKPISLEKDWQSRFQGKVTILQHRVSWTSVQFGNTPSLERPRISHTDVTLCDECWGALLEWANRPNQERLKIAAENRRMAARRVEVAEARREKEVQRLLAAEADAPEPCSEECGWCGENMPTDAEIRSQS